ncbi:S8 family peptidase [Robertmurraya andreesenii]|uniref:SLH domain-containing protein n=1 Tax=Anoxybacillus andreesenii TaxID=1325932 RepID=A0ABT9UZX9_9BACL|nr:S8 family serine peptidase [Robertmurraya andreesenii]MDQ0154256.1 hypothetical protein [Robertmurraya andreesenii]
MKKQFLLFLTTILLIMNIPLYPSAEQGSERVLILFKNSIDGQLLQDESVEIHHIYDSVSAVSATVPSSKLASLRSQPNILKIESDHPVETSEQIENWGFRQVLANEAKTNGWTGKGVKVGIIDTGIRPNHPDLKIAGGVTFVEGTSSYADDEGHGTHVAGIIGALDNDIGTVGVAPEAQIYAIKALNNTGVGNLSDVLAGIEWGIENNLDIINLSLTSEQGSSILERVLDKAYNRGILIVAASGNTQTTLPATTDVLYPARYQSVIAVGSVNNNLNKSRFSYFGPSLEFVAPGEKIYSTYNQPDYQYSYGTSMAAPYVAGIAALYKQAYPELNHRQIRELMQNNAVDLGEPGKDKNFGYGLVQAPTTARVFADVPTGEWYADEISYLYKKGIVTGYDDKKFLPNHPVNRAEAITMIGRALEYDGTLRTTRYTDVSSGHFASGYIEKASEEQIITGYPGGSFKPNASIIRGDVAVMLERAYHYTSSTKSGFSDVKNDKYYADSIYALVDNQISEGYPDKTFKPLNNITRAEFSVFLARVLDASFR